jgi:hypothetical protein
MQVVTMLLQNLCRAIASFEGNSGGWSMVDKNND